MSKYLSLFSQLRFPVPFSRRSIVSAYLRREFLRLFFLAVALFLFLAVLIDFFDRLNYLVKYKASTDIVLLYFLFKIPLFVTQTAPVASLTATLISIGILSRNREITALKACGISQWQIAKPFLLAAGVLSLGVWAWNETIVPHSYHQSRTLNLKIKKRVAKTVFHEHGFWYHGNKIFYHIDHFDSRNKILSGLTIYVIDNQLRVSKLVKATQAIWQDGEWKFEGLQEDTLFPDSTQAGPEPRQLLQETPDDFALVDVEPDEFSSHQLRNYIDDLQRKGLDTTMYRVDLRLKGAMPFSVFAMTLLGVALSIPGAKQLSMATATGLALAVGFGYWLLLALTISLGHGGLLTPVFAAWSANGVSILVGIFFLLGVE